MSDSLYDPRLPEYLDSLVPERDPVMQEMEAHAREVRFTIIGPAAGYLLYQIARLTGARRIFELGSGFGYSTAWFCKAVRANGGGEVHHVVWSEELSAQARGFLGRMGYDDLVQYHVGEAVKTLREMPGEFDMMFNDIDKDGYPASIAVIKEKLRPGGVLLIDNMLWHARIFDPNDTTPATQGVHEVTRLLTQDPAFTSTLLPLRDGVILAHYHPVNSPAHPF